MFKSNTTLNRLACLFCFAALLATGCDSGTEKPAQKTVVRQKIMTSPKANAPGPEKTTSSQAKTAPRSAAEGQKASAAATGSSGQNAQLASIKPYSAAGKTDPFVPLFRKDETADDRQAASAGKKRKKRVPRTPLERVDLSQLKLTGIIRSPQGNKALVEEATGKGYVVGVGTYLGNQGGKITEILDDRLIVEEEIESPLGEVKKVPRQLKLQKSSGE
jgi:type IV pilus assembly protein PilP